MRYSSLTLLTIGAVTSQVAGGVIEARSSLEFVFRRQDKICTTECSAFYDSLDICETTDCLCTTSVAMSLNRCANCYYQEAPTTSVEASVNHLIDTYHEACAGISGLPPISITGAPGGLSTTSTTSTSRTLLPTSAITSASQSRVMGSPTTIDPPATQTIIRAPSTITAGGAATTVSGPNSGNSGNSGLPGLGSGAQSLSAGAYPIVMVVALAMGAFAL